MVLTIGFVIIFMGLFAFGFYWLARINIELREHTKRRHKHYRKIEKITRELIDDTPIDKIKVGGTD